jgi:hypothetical protein
MKTVAKHYFTHPSVWIYILIGMGVFGLSFYFGFFQIYYYVLFIPILIAPFFEWFAHKYILHAKIGNVVELSLSEYPQVKIGDKLTLTYHKKEVEMEVLEINSHFVLAGYGWARKLKPFRDFMHALHYGHHEDPNKIDLIFAPILSVIILFISLFGVSFLVTFNIGVTTVFTLGVIIYYLHYEWMHLGHHIPGYKHIFPWSNKLKTAHQLHHYKNENYWWGITNILGDIIFGTYKKHDEVERSETIKNINL